MCACIAGLPATLSAVVAFSPCFSTSAAEFDSDGVPDLSTVKPLVDGGTEGLKGHARVLLPGITPCFECTLWLFPPQVKFPLCTLAETPRYEMINEYGAFHRNL